MNKIYVLDTNVLLLDPHSLLAFEDRDVIVPLKVIEELDRKKTMTGEIGYNARETFRILKNLKKDGEDLWHGVKSEKGGIIRIEKADREVKEKHNFYFDEVSADVEIIQTALTVQVNMGNAVKVILVTNDTAMQLIAEGLGLSTENYRKDRLSDEDLKYTGRRKIILDSNEKVLENLEICHNYLDSEAIEKYIGEKNPLSENEFIEFIHPDGSVEAGKYRDGIVISLNRDYLKPYEVIPRNTGQRFLLDALLAPVEEIPLVIVKSCAGTGKTFLTMAAAVQKTVREDIYSKIIYTRANVEFDRDIGALPGTEAEKMNPLIRPCLDNLELLVDSVPDDEKAKDGIELPTYTENLFLEGIIRAESLSFMRGRSLANTFLFVDEAQNCSINQIKGILTRPGEGTKIVIAGDPDQIDNRFLDKYNNGLSYAADRFRNSSLAALVTLENAECTRSALAMEAAKLL